MKTIHAPQIWDFLSLPQKFKSSRRAPFDTLEEIQYVSQTHKWLERELQGAVDNL